MFLEFTESQLKSVEKPVFKAKEVVEFTVLDFKEDGEKGDLKLSTKVLTGDHADCFYTHFINNNDHEVSQKNRIQFALAFWTKEELIGKTAHASKLIGRKFSAVAGVPKDIGGGQIYQNFYGWRDLGTLETSADDLSKL